MDRIRLHLSAAFFRLVERVQYPVSGTECPTFAGCLHGYFFRLPWVRTGINAMKMSLYYFPSCPFCVKVLNVIDELGIHIELRDKRVEPRYADELRAATGTTMVPCLRIEEDRSDRWMHESDDIVEYLRGLPGN
jgi:glutaredoxin